MKDTSPLLLRPISVITDKDANDLLEIMDLKHLAGVNTLSLINTILENYQLKSGNVSLWLEINDYLRSKGYAVPYMQFSVEDLVKMGWVKLI